MQTRLRIRVRVTAGARRESLKEIAPDTFEMAVKEKAERGEANERVRTLIAGRYRAPLQSVRIYTGHRGKHKVLELVY